MEFKMVSIFLVVLAFGLATCSASDFAPAQPDENSKVDGQERAVATDDGTIISLQENPIAPKCTYCGGFSHVGCSNHCYWSGYGCYSCIAHPCYCVCSNSGC
ncbi:hypothetical protein Fcan01_16433 [Folsomia candida]|uniref:Uncharacterized protein n=1 Tax=Folsomia candida TaxID=158441 RepID=A0A226DU72_FOLCA|nr:hypothetical protein Fcan01_16433 [Folsomia candida]